MSVALVTGFGPYADQTDNPSGVIASRLDNHSIDGVRIRGCVLPVGTALVGAVLAEAIKRVQPEIVVVTGVAPGRTAPALERVAVNVRDFPIPDIDGHGPIDEVVVPDGPDAYLSTLPVKAILSRWGAEGIPGYVSNTAGTFVCNQTFYLARHLTRDTPTATGLVHIPAVSSQAATMIPPTPSLPAGLIEHAIRLAVMVAATHEGPDLPLGAGAIC